MGLVNMSCNFEQYNDENLFEICDKWIVVIYFVEFLWFYEYYCVCVLVIYVKQQYGMGVGMYVWFVFVFDLSWVKKYYVVGSLEQKVWIVLVLIVLMD